jgi:hypothetical protein
MKDGGANYVQYNNDQNGKQEFAPIDVAKMVYSVPSSPYFSYKIAQQLIRSSPCPTQS